MLEGGGGGHADGAPQFADELPRVQGITQVDEARRTVDH